MPVLYGAMILTGVAAAGWGLCAAHRLKQPLDILAALAALAGVLLALLGTLLLTVPDFFRS